MSDKDSELEKAGADLFGRKLPKSRIKYNIGNPYDNLDLPFDDTSYYSSLLVYKSAKDYGYVCITGDGAMNWEAMVYTKYRSIQKDTLLNSQKVVDGSRIGTFGMVQIDQVQKLGLDEDMFLDELISNSFKN